MPDSMPLPELARSLRTFGAPHDAAGDAAHAAIFAPLLDARARAALGDVEAALSAMRGAALAVRIEARVADSSAAGETDPARGRARAARGRELLERLQAELIALDALAVDARGESTESPQWASWVTQLRRVFAVADDACRALAQLLAEPAEPSAVPRRWFGR